MPVNMRGGKGFKKGKKGGGAGDDDNRRFVGRTAGQDYARVIRLLGNRRVLCFCNDGAERMCKIRGALCRGPKKQIIGVGDVVLYSLRDLGGGDSDDDAVIAAAGAGSGAKEIGDIIGKYDAKEFRHIRKEAGIHRLLLAAETGGAGGAVVDDDIFDREAGAASDEDSSNEEKESGAGAGAAPSGWSRGAAVAAAAAAADEDVDIDAI